MADNFGAGAIAAADNEVVATAPAARTAPRTARRLVTLVIGAPPRWRRLRVALFHVEGDFLIFKIKSCAISQAFSVRTRRPRFS